MLCLLSPAFLPDDGGLSQEKKLLQREEMVIDRPESSNGEVLGKKRMIYTS